MSRVWRRHQFLKAISKCHICLVFPKQGTPKIEQAIYLKLSENLTENFFPYFCDLYLKKGKLLKRLLRLLISVTWHRAQKNSLDEFNLNIKTVF